MTTALVTGGAGFIGSSIARRLLELGWDVRVFDNLLTGFEESIPSGVEFVRGDLRNLGEVKEACKGAEIVFHQGALRSVPRSVDDPVLTEECNALGTLHLLLGAEEAGVRRVVYASSSSVYGDVPSGRNREDMAPDPRSPYAVSKLAGELYCRVWAKERGLSTVSLRYFNVFGPGQHPESKYAAVFPAFISALVEGRTPEVHWDGEQSRDFTFIDDVVEANLAAANADSRADGEMVNVAEGRPKTVNEVLRAVSDAIGRWVDPVSLPRRAGDVRRTHADIARARDLLGWEPRTAWNEGVAATVRWFLDRAQGAGRLQEDRTRG